MSLSKLREMVKAREAWHVAVRGAAKRVGQESAIELNLYIESKKNDTNVLIYKAEIDSHI